MHPKHLFRNCLHLLGRSSTVLSSVHHFGCACHDASTCCVRIHHCHPLRALRVEIFRNFNHLLNVLDHMYQILSQQKNMSSTFVTTSSNAFMACLSPGAFFLTHCGSCLVDRGGLDAFTASFTVASPQRSSALFCRVLAETRNLSAHRRCFLESWQRLVNTRPAHVVNLLFTTVFR